MVEKPVPSALPCTDRVWVRAPQPAGSFSTTWSMLVLAAEVDLGPLREGVVGALPVACAWLPSLTLLGDVRAVGAAGGGGLAGGQVGSAGRARCVDEAEHRAYGHDQAGHDEGRDQAAPGLLSSHRGLSAFFGGTRTRGRLAARKGSRGGSGGG